MCEAPGCSPPSLKDRDLPVNIFKNLFTVVSILFSFNASFHMLSSKMKWLKDKNNLIDLEIITISSFNCSFQVDVVQTLATGIWDGLYL